MVAINCAAIPENLLESELFGHGRGAFTDAHARQIGHFERAHKGTIFLDEIGEMSPGIQAKLLRVLEQNTFTRVGGQQQINVDVRVIAATNRDLDRGLQDGTFRTDLYFRLNVVAIHLPPLRERAEDLPLLIRHFLRAKALDVGLPEKGFDREAIDLLLRYGWPGNVRELENVIERALVLSQLPELGVEDLPGHLANSNGGPTRAAYQPLANEALPATMTLSDAAEQLEHRLILEALTRADHNQTRAAQILGMTRRILKYKMDKLELAATCRVHVRVEAEEDYTLTADEEPAGWVIAMVDDDGVAVPIRSDCEFSMRRRRRRRPLVRELQKDRRKPPLTPPW